MFDKKKNRKEYYLKNRDKELSRAIQYYQINKDRQAEKHRAWLKKNRDINNAKRRERYKYDFRYRVNTLLRSRFNKAFRRFSKNSSCLEFIGCSLVEFKSHIEAQFVDGMSWDNWSYDGWHLDHIIPVSSFDLSDEKQIHKAFNYKNLQPLWKQENLLKSNRV
jgi:hypothetical protein